MNDHERPHQPRQQPTPGSSPHRETQGKEMPSKVETTKSKIYCLSVADIKSEQYHTYAISEDTREIISTATCHHSEDVRLIFQNEYHRGIFKQNFPNGYELIHVHEQEKIPFQIKSLKKGEKL